MFTIPTNVNLLWDSMRCTVWAAAGLAEELELVGWRQHQHIRKLIKKRFNRVRTSRQRDKSPELVVEYLEECRKYLARTEFTLSLGEQCAHSPVLYTKTVELQEFIEHARRQIDQVLRRLLNGETIPYEAQMTV